MHFSSSFGRKTWSSNLSQNVRAGNDAAPRRHAGRSVGRARARHALGRPPPSASGPRPCLFEASRLPQAARAPRRLDPPPIRAMRSLPGRCPPVHPRCFPLCAVPRRAHRSLSREATGLRLFKAALLPRASAVTSPRSAASTRATPWSSGPLTRVQRRTATLNPPLGPAEARTAALCPAPSPPSPDFKPPRPPPLGSAAQAHRRRLRPG
jgi:hypothetical protein